MELTMQKYKQTEVGLIPEDWKVNTLGEVAFVTKLAGFEYSLHFNSYRDEGDIIVVRGTNITHNKMDLRDIKTIPTSTSNKLLRSKLFKNDLVFAYVGTIGPIFLIEENDRYHLGPNTAKITVEKEINSKYLYHYFTSSFIANEIFETTSIGAQPSLSMTKIRSFKIITPSLKEQKAIATALSDVDELITNLDQLITKKKAIKQGAMQQLLTPSHKGGKRLEGFSGEWVEKTVGDIVEYKNGAAHENCVVENGEYVIVNSKFVSTEGRVAKHSNQNLCPVNKNEILMVLSDIPNGKAIAKCFYVEENNKFTLNQRICSFKTEKADSKFLFLLLNRNPYYLQFDDGVKQTNLRNEDVLSCPLTIPPTIEEQKQISKIIFDLDKNIKNSLVKIRKYQDIKQGMMQELLTGKTRLV